MKEVNQRIPEINMRRHDKLLKVARTIADLNESQVIGKKAHFPKRTDLCGHDRVSEFLNIQAEECPSCGYAVQRGDRYCRECGRVI